MPVRRKKEAHHGKKDIIKFAKDNGVEIIDLKFCDLPGLWQHFSLPVSEFSDDLLVQGVGFDGSSIRGFQSIDESDMLLIPDRESFFMDPFTEIPTLSIICDITDPVTRQSYTRDPRYVAQKAEIYLKGSGVADISYWGPEIEFYIFDNVRFDQTYNEAFYHIDSEEGAWNSGDSTRQNLGYKPRYKEGYFPTPPMDHMQDIRSEMVKTLEAIGIHVEIHHGLLAHADALCALIAPTTNSYRRLIPGYEAPINLVYSMRNRSACIRIPMYSTDEKTRRVEFRTPDPSCNPYYAFSAMLMAGLDGIEQKIEAPDPLDKNLYDLAPEEAANIRSVVGSLEAALDALEEDRQFLLKGDVFTPDVIDTWLSYKRDKEVDAINIRPHPYEFALYYDI